MITQIIEPYLHKKENESEVILWWLPGTMIKDGKYLQYYGDLKIIGTDFETMKCKDGTVKYTIKRKDIDYKIIVSANPLQNDLQTLPFENEIIIKNRL
jgi:hypothetical protein